ncbi:MAG TPA: bifunctional 4-hydroxy-2-oxoglutarate aldolase/2-dehydro-3-deoxy-phosphogluconate aldolase [Actinospica sp.]|jgi:2-dehydro-3-deoxyphosphogluconate aldolase/(4S)-4-hydroxy-2-oxoglutarate aldolase|nr:bifunctional 4-hydroxy-2-oxoglutarate aldolase/2-dehydro-3-deoxy-phosphogluconate aldolase [Actinospica sp.]
MYRHEIVHEVLRQRIVGIVRTRDTASAVTAARTMLDAGMRAVEVTLTNPGALPAIEELCAAYPHATIGAGTVLDESAAVAALRSGARFLVSPHLDAGVVRAAHRYGAAALPGAGSATEIVAALSDGADAVKLFPASSFAPRWISDVRAAIPQAPIVPTGGVRPEDVPAWVRAGAAACGVGAALTAGPADEAALRIRALLTEIGRD